MRVPQANCVGMNVCDTNKATLEASECGKGRNDGRPRNSLSKAVLEIDKVQYISNVCVSKLASLATTVQGLKCYVHRLVERERKFVKLLQIADTMWVQMEGQYVNMIKSSKENEAVLLNDVDKIEKSFGKYSAGCKHLGKELNEIKESEGKLRRVVEEKEDRLNCLTEQNAVLKRRLDILNEEIKMHCDNNDTKQHKLKDIENYAAQIKHLQSEISYEENNCTRIECLYKERITKMREEIEKSYTLLTELNISNECYQSQIQNELMDQSSILNSMKICSNKCDTDMARLARNHEQNRKQLMKKHNTNELGTSITNLDPVCDSCTCGTICKNHCVCLFVKTRFLKNIYDKISDMLYEELHTNLSMISEQIMGKSLENDCTRQNTEYELTEFIIESVAVSLDDTIMAAIVKTNCEMTLEINNILQDCVKQAVEGNCTRPQTYNFHRFENYQQGHGQCQNAKLDGDTCKSIRTKSVKRTCSIISQAKTSALEFKGLKSDYKTCKCLQAESLGNSPVQCDKLPIEAEGNCTTKVKWTSCIGSKNAAGRSKDVNWPSCLVQNGNRKDTSFTPKQKDPCREPKEDGECIDCCFCCYGRHSKTQYKCLCDVPLNPDGDDCSIDCSGRLSRDQSEVGSKGSTLDSCGSVSTESVERTGCILSEAKEKGCTMQVGKAQCYNLRIKEDNTAKFGAKVMGGGAKWDACKCVRTESVERTGCIISQANEAGCRTVGKAQCYNLPIEVEDNTAKFCAKVMGGGAKLDACKCVPTESVERTGCKISEANEAGSTTVGKAQCYNLPIKVEDKIAKFGSKVMGGGAKWDACKCVRTESVERTGCIISQANEAGCRTVGKAQCYNLPIEVEYDTPKAQQHKFCAKVMGGGEKLDACKCVRTESVERTGCIISQANETGCRTVGKAQCYNLPIEDNIAKFGAKVMGGGGKLDACKCVRTESVERTCCIITQANEAGCRTIGNAPVQCYNLPIEVGDKNTAMVKLVACCKCLPTESGGAEQMYLNACKCPPSDDPNMNAPSQSLNKKDITFPSNLKEYGAPTASITHMATSRSIEYGAPTASITHMATSRSIVTLESECIQEQIVNNSEMFEETLYQITISSDMDQKISTNEKLAEFRQLEEQQQGKSSTAMSSSSKSEAYCDNAKCSIFTKSLSSICCLSEHSNPNRKKTKKKRHEKLEMSNPKNDFDFAINFAKDILALIEKQFKYLKSEKDKKKQISKLSSKEMSSKLRNLINTYHPSTSNTSQAFNNKDKTEKSKQNDFTDQSTDYKSSIKCPCKVGSNLTTKKLCPAQVKKNQIKKGELNQPNEVNETGPSSYGPSIHAAECKPKIKSRRCHTQHMVVNNKSFYSSCKTQLPVFLRNMSSH